MIRSNSLLTFGGNFNCLHHLCIILTDSHFNLGLISLYINLILFFLGSSIVYFDRPYSSTPKSTTPPFSPLALRVIFLSSQCGPLDFNIANEIHLNLSLGDFSGAKSNDLSLPSEPRLGTLTIGVFVSAGVESLCILDARVGCLR